MRLAVFQSLWAMEGQLPADADSRSLTAIAAAGFDGVLVPHTTPDARRVCEEAAERGLGVALGCVASSRTDLEAALDIAGALDGGVDHVNLQPDLRPRSVDECLGPLREWSSTAAARGVPLYVETHRGRMTNDLLFTLDLLDSLPELLLTADLSHYVVGGEMRMPISAENERRIDAVLGHSRSFHGRVAAAGAIQAQIHFDQHRALLAQFEAWWGRGLRRLATELAADATVVFTVELGPPPFYAATGRDGTELSDRWLESLELMGRVRAIGARVSRPELPSFDLLDPDQVAEPYELLAKARREMPVFFESKMDLWCLTRSEDVLEVLRDTERFSNSHEEVGRPPAEVAGDLPMGHPVAQSLDTLDPPRHTRIRKLVQKSFTPRAVARWEDDIRSICEGLIDRFVDRGQVDLMADFAMLFPSQVIAGVLGMPRSDGPALKGWTDDWFQIWLGDDPPEVRLERWRRTVEFDAFIRRFVEERRAQPEDDLASMMIHARSEDGEPSLSDWEVICVIAGIIAAGSDTTSMLIGEAIHQLLGHPEVWARVQADRSLIPQTLEETLRLRNVVRSVRRVTTCPVAVADIEIPTGSAMWVGLASHNHDAAAFDRPDEFDIDRKDLGEHLGFGRWTHFCLGAPLARLESRVATECLIDRLPDIRLGEREREGLAYVPNAIVPAIRHLDLLWD